MTPTHRITKIMDRPVVLAAGGTGGHVFPALAVADALRSRGYRPILVTDKRGATMVAKTNDATPLRVISAASPFQGGIVKRLVALAKIGIGMTASLAMMIRHRPALMIGFGGYPSFGPMASAKLLAIPMILHEQNGFLGRANHALARLAGHLAVSWPDTANLPTGITTRRVGMPVRDAFFAAEPLAPTEAIGEIRILIIGGSQGAAIFADLIPAAIAKLSAAMRSRLRVSQQCRAEQLDDLSVAYKAITIKADIAAFYTDMPTRIADSHLVITRSGASAVAEIAAAGRPAILIPLPGAMDDHQTMNARQLETAGGGIILSQEGLDAERLAEKLASLLGDAPKLAQMGQNARTLARPDAASAIADYALSLIGASGHRQTYEGGTA